MSKTTTQWTHSEKTCMHCDGRGWHIYRNGSVSPCVHCKRFKNDREVAAHIRKLLYRHREGQL